jgi:hypothetical protein
MGDIIPIHSRRIFSADEAQQLLPVVRRITEKVAREVADLQEQIRFVPQGEALYQRLSARMELSVRRWSIKITQLGCEPRGTWLVDFNSGEGWFTWRLGDDGLAFFHSHDVRSAEAPLPISTEFPS